MLLLLGLKEKEQVVGTEQEEALEAELYTGDCERGVPARALGGRSHSVSRTTLKEI